MQNIYLIQEYIPHEGMDVISAHSSYQKALKTIQKMVKEDPQLKSYNPLKDNRCAYLIAVYPINKKTINPEYRNFEGDIITVNG